MKLKIFTILSLLSCVATMWAQNPKWFKKARKSQVTVITKNANDEIQQAQGIVVSEEGEVITEYDVLKGAVRGSVVDGDGNEYNIINILGANSLYNVARIKTDGKKMATPSIVTQAQPKNQLVYIMPLCSNDKKAICVVDTIKEVQLFNDDQYPYYTLSKTIDSRNTGCPVFNEEGEFIGNIQLSATDNNDDPAYVVGVQYGNALKISALDANNADLAAINIVKALPDDEAQATTYLYLMNKQNATAFENQTKAFIEKYPKNTTGYVLLAELKASQKDYKSAEEIYSQAAGNQTQNEDELHHSFAKLLYQCGLMEQAPYEGWDMEHALKEANAAYSCNPLPLYSALEGLCLYALKRYDEAYDKFIGLTKTNMRSAEYFMYASQCKQMTQAPAEEILAMQDSAINCFNKPYPTEAASYLYLRAKTLASMERYREAVTDMNEFEHLASGSVSATFCYEREQMEIQCRMYAKALSDIERAVTLEPDEPLFRAEEAVVNYRVGQIKEAINAANEAIKLDDKFADAHRILGICLRDQGKTADARKSLQRAVELGDTVAQSILDKMK